MTFVQVIDCKTRQVEELNKLMDTWVAQTQGRRTATHSLVGKDRSDASHVVEIVEFPSYEEAMRNSKLPETDRTFQEMAALCEETPTFTDLDVVRDEQLNKGAARRFFELIDQGDLGAVDALCTDGFQHHDPAYSADPLGLEASKQEMSRYLDALRPTLVVEDQTAEGNLVTTRWTATGTHTGEFMGLSPTGRPVTLSGHTTFRFRDGRIAEAWWNWDTLGLLEQLGIVEL